jgi:hypothetical protein
MFSEGNNLFEGDGTACGANQNSGDLTLTTLGKSAAEVVNLTLANNGGPTRTHALVAGSPALNAGNNSHLPTDMPFDQRGTGFSRMVSGIVDIGAFEAQSLAITSSTPPGGRYGTPYNHRFTSNGDASVRFTLTTGTLPPGLTLAEDGTLSGTPTAAGYYAYIGVTASDATGASAIQGMIIPIAQAPLTVTARNTTRTYGADNPTFAFDVEGLVNGDSASVLTGTLATSASPASPVGDYAITQGTLAANSNYDLSFSRASLSVARAPLTVTANDVTRRVGTANPTFGVQYTGFVNGENESVLGGSLQLSTDAGLQSAPGSYVIMPSGLSSGNYSISFVPGMLTVTDKDVPTLIWPKPATISYGTPLSATQLNSTASVAGSFSYSLANGNAAAGARLNAGNGQLLRVVFTPADSTNYAPVTTTVTLDVSRAPLTVTAQDASRTAGQANPAFSASFAGFVYGETAAVLGGTLSFTTAATASSPAGSYAITPSGLSSSNYAITFVPGTLTVTAPPPQPQQRIFLPLVQR